MQTTTTNTSAILRGEQRSTRFRYRHSVAAAAQEIGIPAAWIWFWLLSQRLKFRTWLRKVWVRLESVQQLFADEFSVRDAFYATGEHLTSPKAIQQAVERWPDAGLRPYIKFKLPEKFGPRSVKLVSNPFLGEEETA